MSWAIQGQLRWTRPADMHIESPCLGSGAIEAGCETVVEERCKRSGIDRREKGACAILDPRRHFLGERYEKPWNRPVAD